MSTMCAGSLLLALGNLRITLVGHDDRVAAHLRKRGHVAASAELAELRLEDLPPSRQIFLVVCGEEDDGAKLVRLRRTHKASGIIAMTAAGSPLVKSRLLEAGADSCVELPSEVAVLDAWINAVARRMLNDWSSDRDGVRLDPEESIVRIGARLFSFRRTEYSICEYLVQNRGRWVPERELLRSALHVRHDRETSLVRVHIRHIRKALGDLKGCIISRRGRGYQFRLPDAGVELSAMPSDRAVA